MNTSPTRRNVSSAISINELPDIILLHLLSYFTPQQLCTTVAPVCSRWHNLSRTPILWKSLSVVNVSQNKTVTLFRTSPMHQLRSLDISPWCWSSQPHDDLLNLVAKSCPRLTRLRVIDHLRVTADTFTSLAAGCPDLVELDMFTLTVERDGVRLPADDGVSFAPFSNLRVLHVALSIGVLDVHLIRDYSQLESLHLSLLTSTTSSLQPVTQFVKSVRGVLVSLKLSGGGPWSLYTEIAQCRKLTTITISSSHVEQLCDGRLSEFGKSTSLKTLELQCERNSWVVPRLTSAGLTSAFSTAGCFSGLNELCIRHLPAVTDDVLIALANNFHSQLTSLTLDACVNVTDTGVTRVVTKCSRLETLRVTGAKLTVIAVWIIPNSVPRLRELTLQCPTIDVATVDELKVSRPNVNVDIRH